MQALQQRPDWGDFLTAEWGGGVLFDLGVHPVAVALLLAGVDPRHRTPAGHQTPGHQTRGQEVPGAPRVTSVRGRLEGADDIEVDEHAEVEITLDTGLVLRVVASWRASTPRWDLQVASDEGVVRADLLPHLTLEHNGDPVAVPAPSGPTDLPQLHQFGYVAELTELTATLGRGVEPLAGAELGRLVLEVVCAASASAAAGGRPVALPFSGPRDRTPQQLWQST